MAAGVSVTMPPVGKSGPFTKPINCSDVVFGWPIR
jgi:hypothetical protein